MLRLSPQLAETIGEQAAHAYPNEGCGLLLGRLEEDCITVVELFPVENRWEAEDEKVRRFRITGEDMLQAELAAMAQDLEVVGVYHSHPDHPPVASPRDLAWAAWPGYSYLITEVRGGHPASSQSWQLLDDRSGFVEEKIEVS